MSVNRNGTKYITDRKKSIVFDSITGVVYAVKIMFFEQYNMSRDKLTMLYRLYNMVYKIFTDYSI